MASGTTQGGTTEDQELLALTDQDRAWLALYLDCNQDLHALAIRLASLSSESCADSGLRTEDSGPSLFALASWLRMPRIRAALADWDYAQRRARHAREEADKRVAIDALKTVCLQLTERLKISAAPATRAPSVPSAASVASASSASDPSAASAALPPSVPSVSSADSVFSLVEVRRAATTLIRALADSRHRRGAGHRHVPGTHNSGPRTQDRGLRTHPRPRRIAEFNLGPAEAERFLEREKRENDRLQKLVQRTLELSGRRRSQDPPSHHGHGDPTHKPDEHPTQPTHGPHSTLSRADAGVQHARQVMRAAPPQQVRSVTSLGAPAVWSSPAARLAGAAGRVPAGNNTS